MVPMRSGSAHRRLAFALLAAALMPVAALAQDRSRAEREGEALLVKNCARCHATGRSGVSTHPEAPAFRTLSRKYPIDGLAEALAEGFSVGHPDMPEFVFEVDEVRAILAYLHSIQEP
jgi:mono/diheme cytochrome c family protein